jgi:hypothetical protein
VNGQIFRGDKLIAVDGASVAGELSTFPMTSFVIIFRKLLDFDPHDVFRIYT